MRASHPDLLNSCLGYVSVSRASQEATLFADDSPNSNSAQRDVSKTSAMEIASQRQGPGAGIELSL